MRSIGKIRIRKVVELTRAECAKDKNAPAFVIQERVRTILPVDYWETWEMADQEINRIIYDEVMRLA